MRNTHITESHTVTHARTNKHSLSITLLLRPNLTLILILKLIVLFAVTRGSSHQFFYLVSFETNNQATIAMLTAPTIYATVPIGTFLIIF